MSHNSARLDHTLKIDYPVKAGFFYLFKGHRTRGKWPAVGFVFLLRINNLLKCYTVYPVMTSSVAFLPL